MNTRHPRSGRRDVRAAALAASLLGTLFGTLLVAAPLTAQNGSPPSSPEATQASPASFGGALALAQEAFAAGDQERLVGVLRAAVGFAPEHGLLLFHLARAEALTGRTEDAVRTLERLAPQGATRDVEGDTAFAALRGSPRFLAAVRRLRENAAAIVRSDTSFALPDPDFIPEGIAHDPREDRFYVGSLHHGQIVRVTPGGEVAAFTEPGQDGVGQVIGIRVDAERRRLWAATLAPDSLAPRFQRGRGGWSALHVYDLANGRLLARYPAPDSTRPHLLNDIALTPGGDVYVTDSEGAALYHLPAGGAALERVHGGAHFTYPNGIAVSADGSRLHVAHAEGVSTLSLTGGSAARVERLTAPEGVTLGGIDGLYACGTGLLAVQRLLDFQQVSRIELSADGRTAVAVHPLERRHPAHDAATTGAIAGGAFHYIADARLARLRPEGGLAPVDAPRGSVVLRLPLGEACAASDGGAR